MENYRLERSSLGVILLLLQPRMVVLLYGLWLHGDLEQNEINLFKNKLLFGKTANLFQVKQQIVE